MADKEPHERAAPLHLTPQMARKEKRADEPADVPKLTNSGFYSSSANKAKLMLPTALWFLLFIAGICFLTLLASLNKTIGTLDTLVEMEQAKEARAAISESIHQRHHHHHHQNDDRRRVHGHKKSRLTKDEPRDLDVSATDDWRPASASWFSAPSWASLEPRRHEQRPLAPPPDFVAEIVPLGDGQEANFMVASSEPLGPAMMSQVMPIFESLAGGAPREELARAQLESPGAPMISAKIDNVHVHINDGDDDSRKKSGAEEDISSLEKSIDQLVGKLMDQRAASRKEAHQEQLLPVFPQLDDIIPPPPHDDHHHHNNNNRRPLSNLLAPGSLLFQEEPVVVLPLPQPVAPHHMQPEDQLIVSISNELKPQPQPSRETNRHNLSNTRRPTPYEFAPPSGNLMSPFDLLGPMVNLSPHSSMKFNDKPKHDAPWDSLSTDLADSLVQGMFQQLQAQPHKSAGGQHPDEGQIVVLENGLPVSADDMPAALSQIFGPPESSKSSDSKHQATKDDDLSDIINTFFGPPREWEKQQQQKKKKPSIRITEKPITDSVTKATIAPVTSSSTKETTVTDKATTPSDKQLEQLISQLPTSGPLSKSEEKLIQDNISGDLFSDFLGSMFSLPQMSGHSPPASTSGSPPGVVEIKFDNEEDAPEKLEYELII